jgi:hypothetical protein
MLYNEYLNIVTTEQLGIFKGSLADRLEFYWLHIRAGLNLRPWEHTEISFFFSQPNMPNLWFNQDWFPILGA